MGLEEEFGISMEEESAQNIIIVQEAADMIDLAQQRRGLNASILECPFFCCYMIFGVSV